MNEIVITTFLIGYLGIVFEHKIQINKTATAILTGIGCWIAVAILEPTQIIQDQAGPGQYLHWVGEHLSEHLAQISEILFFLLGAMTIVEVIDSHHGFKKITSLIRTQNVVVLIWIISFISFFLSAALDNLTTSIVMVSLLRKLIKDQQLRLYIASIIVISSNAGGAWSPIGDVTTTMLWVGGQISAENIVKALFIPSMINMLVPLLIVSFLLRKAKPFVSPQHDEGGDKISGSDLIFALGLGGLLFVPIFKSITHLPPYMGILLILGLVWASTEWIHKNKPEDLKSKYSTNHALAHIDTPSILFFLGILLAVGALETLGILEHFAGQLAGWIGNQNLIVFIIGIASGVVDNVPLVAASMAMYNLKEFPMDHPLWTFLAYAGGTGGSIFIIGSAAGVAVMGMEKIDFVWYMKRFTLLALSGYLAGCGWYLFFS